MANRRAFDIVRRGGVVVLWLALAMVFPGRLLAAEAGSKKIKVFLVGVDGGTWGILNGLVEAGAAPNFRRLMEAGTYGVLKSTEPIYSPVLWTSIATGLAPEKHGITHFFKDPAHPVRQVNSSDRKAKALWNMASDRGYDSGVIGYDTSWPVDEIRGAMVTEQALNPDRVFAVHPPALLDGYGPLAVWKMNRPEDIAAAVARFTDYPFDAAALSLSTETAAYQVNGLVKYRLFDAYRRDESLARIAEHLLREKDFDLFMITFRGVDFTSHGFWKFREPDKYPVPPEQVAYFRDVVDRYYRYADELLGRMLARTDERTAVLVVSDHGFQGRETDIINYRDVSSSGRHNLEGLFLLSGAPFRRTEGFQEASLYDVAPTVLYLMGLPLTDEMIGKPLVQWMDEDFVKARRIKKIGSYGPYRAMRRKAGSDMTREEVELMKQLGYLQ